MSVMSDSLTLTPWSERCDDSVWSPPLKSEDASSGRSPFLFDEAINSKIALWYIRFFFSFFFAVPVIIH